tara:strand:+ start:452 stop:601 length:150 start_codon:yes stop_codon:yes gene_type:complete
LFGFKRFGTQELALGRRHHHNRCYSGFLGRLILENPKNELSIAAIGFRI